MFSLVKLGKMHVRFAGEDVVRLCGEYFISEISNFNSSAADSECLPIFTAVNTDIIVDLFVLVDFLALFLFSHARRFLFRVSFLRSLSCVEN